MAEKMLNATDKLLNSDEALLRKISKEIDSLGKDPKKLAAALTKTHPLKNGLQIYDAGHPEHTISTLKDMRESLENIRKGGVSRDQDAKISALLEWSTSLESGMQGVLDKSAMKSVPVKPAVPSKARMSQSEAVVHDKLAREFSDIKHSVSGILDVANLAEGAKKTSYKNEGIAILNKSISQLEAFVKKVDASKAATAGDFNAELSRMSAEASAMIGPLNERKAKLAKDAAKSN